MIDFAEYSHMVRTLFKTEGMHHNNDALLHAAIGLSGEVGELMMGITKQDDKNINEELGDIEFYLEALIQQVGIPADELEPLLNNYSVSRAAGVRVLEPKTLVDILVVQGCNILDLAKKCWVYGHTMQNEEIRVRMVTAIAMYMSTLEALYSSLGKSSTVIQQANWEKLAGPNGRFRGIVYSDEAARQRADKVGTEEEEGQGQING